MASPTRWETDMAEGHSDWYVDRFRKMAAEGADLTGEARLIDAMLPRHARVLDAGCGPGRHTAYLHACGHDAVGVDADPVLIDAARQDHAGPSWYVADLATLDLPALGEPEPFDGALMAGNVIVFVAPGTETQVLGRVRAHLKPDGFLVVGFHTDRHLSVDQFDTHAKEADFDIEHRFATWDLRPWRDDAGFAVTVLRRP
jgi:SAM-dependent methyltransferase